MERPFFSLLVCKRFIDAHDVDRGILVSVNKPVTPNTVLILTSQYTMDLHSLLQHGALVPSLENAGEELTALATAL